MQVMAPSTMSRLQFFKHDASPNASVTPSTRAMRLRPVDIHRPPKSKNESTKFEMKIRMIASTTANVVDWPTPAAPPRVESPGRRRPSR